MYGGRCSLIYAEFAYELTDLRVSFFAVSTQRPRTGATSSLSPSPEWDYHSQGYDWELPTAKIVNTTATPIETVSRSGSSGNWNTYGWVCEHNGLRQSPINIDDSQAIDGPDTKNIMFYYNNFDNYVVINNGHSIQFEADGPNIMGFAVVDGETYEAKQFHFHSPSEHTFDESTTAEDYVNQFTTNAMSDNCNGSINCDERKKVVLEYDSQFRRRSLEMHIVHAPKESSNGLVVFGITFVECPKAHNEFLRTLSSIPYFPPPHMHTITKSSSTYKTEARIKLSSPLPAISLPKLIGGLREEGRRAGRIAAYRYDGSLTTPPLTEGVKWFVMRDPIEVGTHELLSLRNALLHEGSRGSYRLIQNSKLVRNNPGPVERVFGYNHDVKAYAS